MNSSLTSRRRMGGFSLIEALIAVVILAVGLLAIARFQSGLVTSSGASKARAEAIALAQEKIDSIRTYNNEAQLVSNIMNVALDASNNFGNTVVTDADVLTTPEQIAGTNADFSRQWAVTDHTVASTDIAVVDVTVSWTDPKTGNSDSVVLSTKITYRNPEDTAAVASGTDTKTGYPSSSGTGKEGGGKYATVPGGATSNDDGTYTYQNTGSNQVELIDSNGYILLRLEDACTTVNGNTLCKDFVKISGYVWFDENDASLSDLYVNPTPGSACIEIKSNVVDTGTYNNFPYNCYAGGNWFGNISVLHGIAQTNSRANVCVGDPDTDGGYGIDEPEPSARRVYRGLLSQDIYIGSDTTTSGHDLTGDDENNDGIGDYQTVGIQDELQLPNPYNTVINANYLAGYRDASSNLYLPGHNFFVKLLGNNESCSEVMIAESVSASSEFTTTLSGTDASGNAISTTVDAFEGNPDSFVCLNQAFEYSSTDASSAAFTGVQTYFYTDDSRLEQQDASGNINVSGYLKDNLDQIILADVTIDASGNTALKVAYTESADASGNISTTNQLTSAANSYFLDALGCRFDPVIVPSVTNTITGQIFSIDASTNSSTGYVVNMSDDQSRGTIGNCTVSTGSLSGTGDDASNPKQIFTYSCKVYHTYSGGSGEGWSGNVVINPAANTQCAPSILSFADASNNQGVDNRVTANVGDTTGTPNDDFDFTCNSVGSGSGSGTPTNTVVTFVAASNTIDYGTANTSETIYDITDTPTGINIYSVSTSDEVGSLLGSCDIDTAATPLPTYSCDVTISGANHGLVLEVIGSGNNNYEVCNFNASLSTGGGGPTGKTVSYDNGGTSSDVIWIGRTGYSGTVPGQSVPLYYYKTGGGGSTQSCTTSLITP